MGKMKNWAIEQMNKLREEEYNQPIIPKDPSPDEIDPITGQSMWLIKGYKIWASTYKEALTLLPLIESNESNQLD